MEDTRGRGWHVRISIVCCWHAWHTHSLLTSWLETRRWSCVVTSCRTYSITELPKDRNCQPKQVANLSQITERGRDEDRGFTVCPNTETGWGVLQDKSLRKREFFAAEILLKIFGSELVVFRLILHTTSCLIAQSVAERPLQAPQCCRLPLSHLSLPNWVFLCSHTPNSTESRI